MTTSYATAPVRLASTFILLAIAGCDPCLENPEACIPDQSGGMDEPPPDDGMDPGEPDDAGGMDPGDGSEDMCVIAFDECINAGVEPEACTEILNQCYGGGGMDPGEPPPQDACWVEYELCLSDPTCNPMQCEQDLNECLGSCDDGQPDDPCVAEYEWCLQNSPDPMSGECDQILQWCYGGGEDPCLLEYDACLQNSPDPMSGECEELLNACWGVVPDPCWDAYDQCLQAGIDPAQCDEELNACWGIPPFEDPCYDEYDACLQSGADPLACEEAYYACWGVMPGDDGQP